MKKLAICFLATIVITTFSVSTGFSTSYTVQPLEMLVALGINDNGDVVGSNGGSDSYVIYSNQSYTTVTPGTISGVMPRRINNSNQIAGTYNLGSNAFWYDGTSFNDLSVPGAVATTSAAISNNGLIVGTYATMAPDNINWKFNGFTYTTGGGFISFPIIDTAGNPLESQVMLEGVNNSGAIIGTYRVGNDPWYGFMFNGTTYTTLVGMDRPLGINDAGQVVGTNNGIGVLYANGQYTLLDFEGTPFDINNQGQIAGGYYGWKGQYGFIASPVPLPPTLLLLGTGLLGLVGWRRFRKG